jgi:hypothetical protein
MARLWGAALLVILAAACVSARDLQQAAGNAQPTSLAVKKNNNIPQLNGSTSSLNAQRAISNTNTGAVSATTIQPQSSDRRTLDQVNADAPTITDPATKTSVRPVASSQVVGDSAASPAGATSSSTVSAQPASSTQVGVVNPYDVVGANPLDREVITGDFISQIVGVRIATPFFGTGFNFCIGEALRIVTKRNWHCLGDPIQSRQ